MKHSTASALLLGASAVTLDVQIAAAQGSASEATLVEFTVVAADQKGEPVTDLTQSDITIVQNGKPHSILDARADEVAGGLNLLIQIAADDLFYPGTTQVRLIVRDRMTGRFGALDMPLSDIRR